jgi:aminoglycoside phosphotransferase family enzyme
MNEITVWQQFGLPGLVIFALFTLIGYIGRYIVLNLLDSQKQQIDRMSEDHKEYINKLLEMHKSEREEWLSTYKSSTQETNIVITELTKVVSRISQNCANNKLEPIKTIKV